MPPETQVPDLEKDAAVVKVFPPVIPLATILLGVVLDRLRPIEVGFQVSSTVQYGIGGLIIGAAVLGLGTWAVVTFRRSGESELPWKATFRIVQRGPYRFTRNPMYLQLVLVCIGVAVLLMNAWIVLLTPICMWLLQRLAILPEEEYLETKFGEEYLAYQRRVRRWI